MPPKGGEKAKKAARREQEKKKDKVVEDKTFGLKNKNKSKVVQKFVQNVQKNIKGGDAQRDKQREEKKQAKLLRIQQEQELKALFSEALSINVKKSDLRKKKNVPDAQPEKGGGQKQSDHYDEAWAEAELAKQEPSAEKSLEQMIEEQREAMRKEGKEGTPVTAESFAAWKRRKAERLREEQEAILKAEQLKKKGGKGLSVLSGKQLFAHDASLFVDDDDAQDKDAYERRDDEDPDPAPPDVAAAVGDASLYLNDDPGDLDDLDDLDDDDDDDDDDDA
eukprot:CAMPEP_0197389872 /NCGR_PEP_ID=MMETSP1165-20131217/2005_1 /TAXON_ID=284809 /ORGANISM="Chrysocystis fragilis, Strain CCMP3189" /LENGTH=277 /DNA_ID=CAMNT_0042915319 /DNA_START=33 /DNA_END=866 /DNA_ORIENTATION=+